MSNRDHMYKLVDILFFTSGRSWRYRKRNIYHMFLKSSETVI